MKLGQTVISVIYGLCVIGVAQVASAEPLAISMTQRDGRVSSQTCMMRQRLLYSDAILEI
jgi:hypothetical protein